jgi:glyoxylase-like metal-dependent hydrolase (beta-lactamase superfamily II)
MEQQMYRILNGIYSVEGLRIGRVYVITGSDGVTLIDTSIPGAQRTIAKELETIGYRLSDVKRILITHAHNDHIGSLAALKEATGASVYAHHRYESAVIRGEKPVLRPPLHGFSRVLSRMLIEKRTPTQVDHELQEGDHLDEVLSGLEVVDTPGHTPGHCCFWLPEQRLLFGGDVMAHLPFGLSLPLASYTPDMEEAKRSIHKVAEMNVATLCLGHGEPYIGNATSAIQAFASKL